ncbi:hypothetical protein Dimus_017810 [Dionaea muscipula]
MSVIHLKKKDIVKSKVRGVDIEFDHEKLTTILRIPGNNGICEYVKDVWEESKYIKPLEITRSSRFGKRDLTSFMDLTYMDHLVNRRRINLPRVMMRHMAYVISVKDHELPYGDWMTMVFKAFGVPLAVETMRRKDDDVDAPEGRREKEDERNKDDFDWEENADAEKGFMMSRMRLEVLRKCEKRFNGCSQARLSEGTRHFESRPSGLLEEFGKLNF